MKKLGKQPLCYCFELYEEEIVQIISRYGVTTLDQLHRYCQAGLGCGTCGFDLEKLISEEKAKRKREGKEVQIPDLEAPLLWLSDPPGCLLKKKEEEV